MKCTEVSLKDQAISRDRVSFLFLINFFGVFCVYLTFFGSCYRYIQLGTVQNYSHDDDG